MPRLHVDFPVLLVENVWIYDHCVINCYLTSFMIIIIIIHLHDLTFEHQFL